MSVRSGLLNTSTNGLSIGVGVGIGVGVVVSLLPNTWLVQLVATMIFVAALGITWKLSAGKRAFFSPPFVFIILFILMNGLGTVVHYLGESPGADKALVGTALGITSFVGGLLMATLCFRFSPEREISDFVSRPVVIDDPAPSLIIMAVGALLSVSLGTLYYLGGGGIPLFEAIMGLVGGSEFLDVQGLLSEGRRSLTYYDSTNYFGQGYLQQFNIIVIPYLSVISFLMYQVKKDPRWGRLTLLLGPTSLILLVGTGQRWPLVSALVAFALSIAQTLDHKRAQRYFVRIITLTVVFYLVMSVLLPRYETVGNWAIDGEAALKSAIDRIVMSQSTNSVFLFNVVPDVLDFSYGSEWWDSVRRIGPGASSGLAARLYGLRHPGKVGSASTSAFAEGYYNLGYYGVCIAGLLIGFFWQWITIAFVRSRKSVLSMATLGILTVALGMASVGTLAGVLYQGAAAVLPLWVLIRWASRLITGKPVSRSGQPGSEVV